jgi:hypothetical protein
MAPANTTGFKKGVRNISLRIVYPCPYGLLLTLKQPEKGQLVKKINFI